MRRGAAFTPASSHHQVFFRAAEPQVLPILRSVTAVRPSAVWRTKTPKRNTCMATSTARLPSSSPHRGNAPIACRTVELNLTRFYPLRADTHPPVCLATPQSTSWPRALSNAKHHRPGAGRRERPSATGSAPEGTDGSEAVQGREGG